MKFSLLIVAAGLLTTVALAQDDASKKDLQQLQGKWQLVSREKDGKADPAEAIKGVFVVHEGDKFTFQGAVSGAGASKGTFKVDAAKKPKAMDRIPDDGPQKGKTLEAIYSLEGDKLKICVSLDGKARPSEFATAPKSGLAMSVFERAK